MAFFTYTALDAQGAESSGTLEAESERAAATSVRAQGLRLLRIEVMGSEVETDLPAQYELSDFLPVRMADKVVFFQQVALMIRSGLTVLQALEIAGNLANSSRLRKAASRMKDVILSGKSLSSAMAGETKIFPKIATQLIMSAEASGELDVVLDRVALHFEQKAATRANLVTSMIYPSVVVLAAFGVATFLLIGVVPKFAEFFRNSGRPLPGVTQALVDVSEWVVLLAPFVGVGLLVGGVAVSIAYRRSGGRLVIDRFLLKVPVIGTVILRSSMAQLTWSMSMLLTSGVTLLDSVRVASRLVWNAPLKQAFLDAADDLLAGKDFASSVRRKPIPEMVVRLTAAGEKSGALAQVMQELGDHYDKELQSAITRMSNLIEPLLMLVIGGMVGFVYYAFFQAVFSLTG